MFTGWRAKREMASLLPKPLATKAMTLTATSAITTGVGLVAPTMPVRLRLALANGRITLVFLAPAEMHSGHCHPTGAWPMQSVQIGRSQWAQTTEAALPGCR